MDDLEILGITKKIAEKFDNAKIQAREDYNLLQIIKFIQSKQFDDLVDQCDQCKVKTKEKVLAKAKERGFEIESKPVEHKMELTENMDLGDKPNK